MSSSSACITCPAGSYCPDDGMSMKLRSLSLTAHSLAYCRAFPCIVATQTPIPCPAGFYCTAGAAAPVACRWLLTSEQGASVRCLHASASLMCACVASLLICVHCLCVLLGVLSCPSVLDLCHCGGTRIFDHPHHHCVDHCRHGQAPLQASRCASSARTPDSRAARWTSVWWLLRCCYHRLLFAWHRHQ
jgi:hypothetical protein